MILCKRDAIERDVQNWFFMHLDHFLPGARKVTRADITGDDSRGIPDGWIDLNGILCPVEVKQRTFGSWALDQLLGYLKTYRCKQGIAVAERFARTATGYPRIHYVAVNVVRVYVDADEEDGDD